jgi:peptidoglycan hydrolase CwlO-like protein
MTKSLAWVILPLVIGFAALGASHPLVEEVDQVSNLKACLNEARLNKKELEEEVDELSAALYTAEETARLAEEQIEKLQAQLNDARDIAFSYIPIQ